jgi:hypothetical protein
MAQALLVSGGSVGKWQPARKHEKTAQAGEPVPFFHVQSLLSSGCTGFSTTPICGVLSHWPPRFLLKNGTPCLQRFFKTPELPGKIKLGRQR